MKSILLTTTAIVAFAGAAAAEGHTGVSFSGSATLGYNDETAANFGEDGFYWDADTSVSMSAELDNGLTAGADFTILVADENNGNDADAFGTDGDYTLFLTSESAGLFFGDTEFAAVTRWQSAGDMEADAFSEADGETVIRGDAEVAGVGVSLSYRVADANGDQVGTTITDDVDQLSIGVAADFGMFSMTAGYQEEAKAINPVDPITLDELNGDFVGAEIYALSGSVAVAGADITVAYAEQSASTLFATPEKTSAGIQVAYPFGPVTATVYYSYEEENGVDLDDNYGLTVAYSDGPIAVTGKFRAEQERDEWNLEGSYEVMDSLTLYAGVLNENDGPDEDYYVAGVYDLGGGAELLVSYAEDKDSDQEDEIGANEYLPGTTVEVSFSF